MRHKKYILILFGIILALIIAIFIYRNYFMVSKNINDSFEVNTFFLKVAIEKDKTMVSNLKISNLKNTGADFSLKLMNLGNLVHVNEPEFYLDAKQEKNIGIIFNTNDSEPGVYLGELVITSGSEEKTIPVILEMQSQEVLFDTNVNLFPQGDVIVGQKLNADIKIYDLSGAGRNKVNLAYSVQDFEEKTFFSDSEDLIVDGKLDYSKAINLPEKIKPGNYVLVVIVSYKNSVNSVGTSTTLFNVVEQKSSASQNGNLIFWIVIIFGIFFLVFLALFFYSLFYRDRLLEELQNQYKREIKKQSQLIKCKEKSDYSKLKNSDELREYKKELEKVKKKRINLLNEIHERRVREYKKIKKTSNTKQINEQINKWKKQGYDTNVLENKYKLPDVDGIRKKIERWKKQGYDTSVLEK